VGGLQAGRGLEETLYGMHEFRRHGKAYLTVLGEGPTRGALESLSNQLGLNNHVKFVGWVDPISVPKYICSSDVGIVPHIVTEHTNTTIPNKLFDYMAFARPVLSTNADPMQRIVNQERCGFCYHSGDIADFVHKLCILSKVDNRAVLGMNGYRAVINRYNWKKDSTVLRTTIESIVAE
jgi:glycosyltransferase involved in cell wall biosynthesis